MEWGEVRYARSGDVSIAYLVTGSGPVDVVWVPGAVSNVGLLAETPPRSGMVRAQQSFFERLSGFARLLVLDFTDIVGSTEKMAEVGDRRWRELLHDHHGAVRRQLARFRGVEMDAAGDGFFARFDGPARAIQCAQAITAAVEPLGVQVRAGLHTGECELADGKVVGIAVSIGARIAAIARPSEVLVSSTVKDLVAGSGLSFDDRGIHELKGVPGDWRLYAVGRDA